MTIVVKKREVLLRNFQEAGHRLRVTPRLLKWFTSHSPKRDGRKLQQEVLGNFRATELDAFDNYLRDPWQDKYVPAGIKIELLD